MKGLQGKSSSIAANNNVTFATTIDTSEIGFVNSSHTANLLKSHYFLKKEK